MTYATGQVIRAADYNQLVIGADTAPLNTAAPSIGLVWGNGFGAHGVGQDASFIHPVSTGDVIRATEWDNLTGVLQAIREHQSGPGAYTGPGAVSVGNVISPLPGLGPIIQSAYNTTGTAYANSDGTANTTSYSGIWGSTGSRSLHFTQTVTFASPDHARYFFNAGGRVKLSFSHGSGAATARNSFWNNLAAAAGTVIVGYNTTSKTGGNGTLVGIPGHPSVNSYGGYGGYYSGGNGNYSLPGAGFWSNTAGVSSMHFKQYGTTGGYSDTADYIAVYLTVSGPTESSGGLGTALNFTTVFTNGLVETPSSQDEISGTSSVSLVLSNPVATHLPTAPWTSNTFSGSVAPV